MRLPPLCRKRSGKNDRYRFADAFQEDWFFGDLPP